MRRGYPQAALNQRIANYFTNLRIRIRTFATDSLFVDNMTDAYTPMKTMLINTKNAILNLLFPKFCAGCRSEGVFLCDTCQAALWTQMLVPACPVCSFRNGTGTVCKPCRKKTALSRGISVFPYQEKIIRELLHMYKYNRARELEPILADFLITHARRSEIPIPRTAIVVPVPLHAARRRERGFNQSEEIGKKFAKTFKLAYRDDVLQRLAYTKSQVSCADFRERQKNISGAFISNAHPAIRYKTILLVDDITTSGATLDEAARILKKAGAKSVWGMTVAKG